VSIEGSWRDEEINDGNRRRNLELNARYAFRPRLGAIYNFRALDSRFEPVPFDLYYAPLTYRYQQLELEYTTPRLGWFEVLMAAGVLADNQDGDPGRGWLTRGRIVRRMGRLSEAFLGAQQFHNSATRRLAQEGPYDLTSVNVGYSSRF
jgi:hypothetical protein